MRHDRAELEQIAAEKLPEVNRDEYVKKGVDRLATWLEMNPRYWQMLGPWYAVVQELLLRLKPEFEQALTWNGGSPPPDFLDDYDYGEDFLNLFAALTYLSREGEYVPNPDHPHSIQMPDGSQALFVPGIGIIES